MEYVYGALLLHSAGKEINEDGLQKVLSATGEDVDESRVKALVAALDGVDIEEAIEKAAPVAAAAPAASGGSESAAEEEAADDEEDEEDDEKAQEEASEGLGALFG